MKRARNSPREKFLEIEGALESALARERKKYQKGEIDSSERGKRMTRKDSKGGRRLARERRGGRTREREEKE